MIRSVTRYQFCQLHIMLQNKRALCNITSSDRKQHRGYLCGFFKVTRRETIDTCRYQRLSVPVCPQTRTVKHLEYSRLWLVRTIPNPLSPKHAIWPIIVQILLNCLYTCSYLLKRLVDKTLRIWSFALFSLSNSLFCVYNVGRTCMLINWLEQKGLKAEPD